MVGMKWVEEKWWGNFQYRDGQGIATLITTDESTARMHLTWTPTWEHYEYQGTISGNYLQGSWQLSPSGDTGTAKLEMSADGLTMKVVEATGDHGWPGLVFTRQGPVPKYLVPVRPEPPDIEAGGETA